LPFLGNLYHVWNVFLTASLTPTMVVAAAGMVAIRRAPRQSLLICVLVVIAFALMMFAGWVYDPRTLPRALVASLVPALAFAVLLAIPGQWRTIPIALATVVALLLACLPGGLHLETGVRILDRTLLQPRPRADLDNPSPAIRAVQHQEAGEPFRIASLLNTVYPGIQSYFDLEGITGPDALELREFRELTDAAGILRTQWGWRTLLVERDLTSARGYLDMIGVRYVLASREQPPRMPANLPRLALDAPDELEVVRRDSAWPRAFFVDGVRRHSSVFDVVREATTDAAPFVSVATEDATAIAAVGHLPVRETRRVAAREYRLTSNHTAFVVDAPGPGIVAVTEPYVARDFRATINGSSVDYIQVNHLYKGVVIPAAGTWHVDFEYRPARWTQAWVISGVAGIAFVALLLLTRARNGRAPSGGAFQVAGNGI
jgi:hypothetical protein